MNSNDRRPIGAANSPLLPGVNRSSISGTWDTPNTTVYRPLPPRPSFHMPTLGEAAQDVAAIAEASNTAPDAAAASFLAAVSAAVPMNVVVEVWPGWIEALLLFIGVIMDPSGGKSRAARPFVEALRSVELSMAPAYDGAMADYTRKLIEARAAMAAHKAAVKAAIADGLAPPSAPANVVEPTAPTQVRTVTNDTSKAGMLRIMPGNSILAHWDEKPHDLRDLRPFLLSAYNGQPYHCDRAGSRASIEQTAVSILVSLQPDVVPAMFGGTDDGFSSRFLWAMPQSHPFARPCAVPDEDGLKAKFGWLHRSCVGVKGNFKMSLSADALDIFEAWVVEHNGTIPSGRLGAHYGKLPGIVVRLASVREWIGAAWSTTPQPPKMVSKRSLVSALAMVEGYFKPMAAHAHALLETGKDDPIQRLAEWVVNNAPTAINLRELARGSLVPGISGDGAELAATSLINAGWFRLTATSGKPGRPSKTYDVNPVVVASCKEIV